MLSDLPVQNQFVLLIASPADNVESLTPSADLNFCHLIFAKTFEETISALTSRLFNLIIIDLDLCGSKLIEMLKKPDCLNHDTPVIALANELSFDGKRQLISLGFDDYLLKPLTSTHLNELISLWSKNTNLIPFLDSVQTLLSKSKNNKRLVLALYNKLFEELPAEITRLETAIENGRYQLAFDIIHHLNGSVRTCYLKEIAVPASSLESLLIQENYELTSNFIAQIRQQISNLANHRNEIMEFITRQ